MANKINLNEASIDEISGIEGITKETAQSIVSYRENKKGRIQSLDEISGLNGIDVYLLEKIRDTSTI